MSMNDLTSGEALNVSLGKRGVNNISGTDEYRGEWDIVQVLNETVFDILTESNTDSTIEELTIPAGTVLYGCFTVIKLTSGAVRAYGVGEVYVA